METQLEKVRIMFENNYTNKIINMKYSDLKKDGN